jgi:hypothetical protein
MFDVDVQDVGISMDLWASKVGETTEQATVRLAVGVARSMMNATLPRTGGKRSKADPTEAQKLKAKAAAQMRKVVESVEPKTFTALKNGRRKVNGKTVKVTSAKIGGKWIKIKPERLLSDEGDVWRVVERHRESNGKTRVLSRMDKYICSRTVFKRVASRRAKLWGVAKGSWYGAGIAAARKQKGMDRLNIVAPAWIKNHSDKGQSRQSGENHDTEITLGSSAVSMRGNGALSVGDMQTAVKIARKGVFQYYSKRLRAMKIKGRGAR